MARQKGIIKLKGTIGDITFYKTKDGHLAREKGGIDADRIKNDPAFQRTRENGSEFGRAGKAGKVLRTGLRVLLLNSADSRMVSRLTQSMVKVIQADATNERGLRNVIDGEAELLAGFEFNIRGKLGTSLFTPYTGAIDRVTGELSVDIPSFIPSNMIAAPGGTTHFKIISAGVEVDFENETFVEEHSETAILPWSAAATAVISHVNTVTPNSTKPLFLALGLEFYQEVNGSYWAPNFDHVLTYSKNRDYCVPFFGGINYSSYTEIETEGPRKGEKYQLVRLYMTSLDPMRGCVNQRYFIECPDGSFVIPPGDIFPDEIQDGAFIPPSSGKDKVWRWAYKSYLEKKDQIVVKKVKSSNLVNQNGGETFWNVFTKTYLNDVIEKSSATPNNFIEDHINQSASHELKVLNIPFDFAKPSSLIEFLAQTCKVGENDIVLDFFSGSASSAHAIMKANIKDNFNRKYILVQLPENNEKDSDEFKAGFDNICEIGKERIRRAGNLIIDNQKALIEQKQEVLKTLEEKNDLIKDEEKIELLKSEIVALQFSVDNLDKGFRVYKLDSSNMQDVYYTPNQYEQGQLDLLSDNIKPDRTPDDLVAQIMLDWGLPLSLKIEKTTIANKEVYKVDDDALLCCFDEGIDEAFAKEIATLKPLRIVFRDQSFKDDTAKENVKQLLKQLSGESEMKVI